MTQTHPSSTGALWARFRFSVVGSLLSSPPARIAPGSDPLSCREDLVASRDRARCPRRGRHHRALVLHGAPPARRPGRRLAPCRAQRLRQDLAGGGPRRATPSPVPRSPGLELSTALRQPRRVGEGRSLTGAAPLLFHGQALHAGSRPAEEARASAARSPWRGPRRSEGARRARSAATKPPTSERSGISISTTDRSRCSLPAASGCGPSRWASSTTTRDCAATSSGISRRPPRIWSTDSPRRSRSGACRVPC